MAEQRVLSRQELFELVWSRPIRDLAKEFKLSDVGFAKTCKRYGIPRPERGYWQKLAVGKAPKRPKLPAAPENVGEQVVFTLYDSVPPAQEPVVPQESLAWIERERATPIVVPDHVVKYHPLVRRAKDALEATVTRYGPDDGWRWSGDGAFSIRVTKPHIGRACRIAQAIASAFEQRKFRLEYSREDRSALVYALGEQFKVSLSERQKRIAHVATPEDERRERQGLGGPRKFDDIPSGLLRLRIEVGYRKVELEDSAKGRLDDLLNDAVLWMVRTVIEVLRPEAERRRVEEAKRREEEHKRWLFQQKCDRFDAAYRAWTAQQDRLRFVSVLEDAVAKLETPSERVREFVAWTRRYVEWADPLPTLFEGVEQDKHVYFHEFARKSFA